MSNNNPTTTETSVTKQGFGEILSKARKQKSWSVEDVANELNILKRHVVALEEEDYKSLPDFAFARGFVTNYAKLLHLDGVDDLVKQFEQGYPKHLKQDTIESIKAPLQPMSTLQRERSPLKLNYGLIAGIIGVLFLGVAILKMINGATDEEATPTPDQTHVSEGLSASDQAQGVAIGTGSAIGNTGSAVGNTGSAINSTGSAISNTGSALGAAQASDATLDLWIKGNVNVEVTDATGTKLLTGMQSRGGKQLTGKSPMTVVIDDVTKVDLNFNYNPIRLTNLAQDGKVSVTLPQE